MKTLISLVVLFAISVALPSGAQTTPNKDRTPRVLEVEKMLSREALEFLKARFPGRPFIVNVSIDPLRRISKDQNSEELPYYEIADEERFDEWDDPAFSASALVARVKKINVILTVPADLSEDELTEIKSSLLPSLGMIEGRDSIDIRKRSWLTQPAGEASRLSVYHILTVSGLLLVFLAGLWLIFQTSSSKLTNSLKDALSQKASGGNETTITLPSIPLGSGASSGGAGEMSGMSGSSDVKMLDSLKFLEHVTSGIKIFSDYKDFPRLEDMLIFESFAEKNPGEFGAFISEVPYEIRMRLFGLSHSVHWLEALNNPTDVGNMTLEILQKCFRVQRNASEASWQNLLILTWRLKEKTEQFFSSMPEADAKTILAHLPKGDGVRWARAIFPGNWAQILDPDFKPQPLNDILIEKYSQKALGLLPLRKADLLERHRSEKEVLQYVRLASPMAEKEVYLAAGAESNLQALRAPFYPFFDLNAEQCKVILPKFSIEEWGAALFNTPKPDRQVFEAQLNPKQKIRIYEVFRKLENKEPAPLTVAEIRDRIGIQVKLLSEARLESVASDTESNLKPNLKAA